MTAVACNNNNMAGQIGLGLSQPIFKSSFYSDIYTVKEEVDANSNDLTKSVEDRCDKVHRNSVRFVPFASNDLSNSKDSGIGSSEDQQSDNGIAHEGLVEVEEEDEEFAKFSKTAKQFTDVDVETLSWRERGERMDNCISWLREEIEKMKKHDKALMRQFMELRSTIHQLKRSNVQSLPRPARLRNQMSCTNLGSDQSARSGLLGDQSQLNGNLHQIGSSQSSCSNLSSRQFHSRSNLNLSQSSSRTNLSSWKVSNSLLHLEDSPVDVDALFADMEPETDSFFEEDDADIFSDHQVGVGGGKLSALSEDPYMPQYRTRTVSLVSPDSYGRPSSAASYIARSRYMSFSSAKGRIESERAILE